MMAKIRRCRENGIRQIDDFDEEGESEEKQEEKTLSIIECKCFSLFDRSAFDIFLLPIVEPRDKRKNTKTEEDAKSDGEYIQTGIGFSQSDHQKIDEADTDTERKNERFEKNEMIFLKE